MKRALTIAGSDPSGGAGVQADLGVFTDLGVYGLSVIAAVTAQNSMGVQKIHKLPPRVVAAQLDSVARDMGADACKVGMLYSPQVVSLVAERIKRRQLSSVVLDPVFSAKDGTRLLASGGLDRMRRELIPRSILVTPNLAEAGELAKCEATELEGARQAAKTINGFGARFVLVKGGHLEGEPVDILFDGETFTEFPARRIEGRTLHGTGCILSAAITARLALGDSVPEAVRFAKDYVAQAIKSSIRMGKGGLWYYTTAREGGD